jgi:hypothetical protein
MLSHPLNWLRSVLTPKDGNRNVCQIIFKATYFQMPKSYIKLQLQKRMGKKILVCPWTIICIIILGTDFIINGSYLHLTFPGTCFFTFINMFRYHGYILTVITVPMILLRRKDQGKKLNGLESMHVIANLKISTGFSLHKEHFCMPFETNKKAWTMYIYLCVCMCAHYEPKSAFRIATFMECKL